MLSIILKRKSLFLIIFLSFNKSLIDFKKPVDKNEDYTYSKIISYINERYHLDIKELIDNNKLKIAPNLIIDTFHEFIWPDLNNNYYSEIGTCKGLIDHIGILSDGSIIPCCLDSRGVINLGNIFTDNIDDILKEERVKKMIIGFKNNYKCEE